MLKQITGEDVNVFLNINLILFIGEMNYVNLKK